MNEQVSNVFHPADSVSIILFSMMACALVIVLFLGIARTQYQTKKFLSYFLCYLGIFSGIVYSGLPLKFMIPVAPLLFLSVIGVSIAFAFSGWGSKIAASYSLALLIGLQGFRFPLELILHHWAKIGTIPSTMTWTGQNLDILSGIFSLIFVSVLNRSRWLAWGVQSFSFLLLLNVIRVVIMSSPFPFSWPLENPLLLIGYLPYAFIGPLFVGFAMSLHFITFRKLLEKKA